MVRWFVCVALLLNACGDDSSAPDAGMMDSGPVDANADGLNPDGGDAAAPDAGPGGCAMDLDCDDGDPCTADRCDPGGCVTEAALCIDIRADTNRDGRVRFDDPGDDADEESWDATHGAVFLPNLDDDDGRCPVAGTVEELSLCNDAADEVINGVDDLRDLARLRVAPWAAAPEDSITSIEIDAPASGQIRLFIERDGLFEHWPEPRTLSAAELRSGVEIAIEATDVVRDSSTWDGFVDVRLEFAGGTGAYGSIPASQDELRMRVAPLRLASTTERVTEVFVHERFAALRSAIDAVGPDALTVRSLSGLTSNGFAGDFFRSGYLAMPAVEDAQTMRIAVRGLLAEDNERVYTQLRGPDVGAVEGYGATVEVGDHPSNLLMIPPHSHAGMTWPYGRALRVSDAATGPSDLDPTFEALLEANGMGPTLYVDGSWTLLKSIPQLVSFVPNDSPRGWVMLIADPSLAISELEGLQGSAMGAAELFVGQQTPFGASAAISINDLLSDIDLAIANQVAQVELDEIKLAIQEATGLTDSEIIPVPALFAEEFGDSLIPYMPSLLSGMILVDGTYLAPDPFGPMIGGEPFFKSAFGAILDTLGLSVVYVDTWLSHRDYGSLHNTINSWRELPSSPVW